MYGCRTCSMATEHVLWPERRDYAPCATKFGWGVQRAKLSVGFGGPHAPHGLGQGNAFANQFQFVCEQDGHFVNFEIVLLARDPTGRFILCLSTGMSDRHYGIGGGASSDDLHIVRAPVVV